MAMSGRKRDEFDKMVEEVVEGLPAIVREYMEEVPLVVEDRASAELLAEVDCDDPLELQGLHLGPDLSNRSVDHGSEYPEQVMLFREAIVELARDDSGRVRTPEIRRQIRITILHEYGHHVGLGEDELRELGYD